MSIWISKAELDKLPTTGSAWTLVQSEANSSWGKANLADNNSSHDVKTLAGALVAARTGDTAMRNKVVEGLKSAMASGLDRALELSRGLQTYIIAADLIGYNDSAFATWVKKMVTAGIQGHSGDGLLGTAFNSPTNWGGHARASLAAAILYLEKYGFSDAAVQDWKSKLLTAYNALLGLPAPGNTMKYTSTKWHAGTPQAGINRPNAGAQMSGVYAEDFRRGGEPSSDYKGSGYIGEGLQGLVVTAVLLHRAGLVPFNASDNAIVRAMEAAYRYGSIEGDDTWIPWVVNAYAGTKFPTAPASSGKNMGFTDWTHATAVTVPPVEPPVDPPPPPPTGYPMTVIASKNWYITLPTKLKATPDTVKQPELATYSDENFYLNATKDGAVFKAPSNGATTSGSNNPRSELREMTDNGTEQAAWSTDDGVHIMEVELVINAVPIGSKPHVVIAQIHGGDDDLTVFRWEGNTAGDRKLGNLWITNGDTSHGHLVDLVPLDTRITVGFYVRDGVVRYSYNGQMLSYELEVDATTCYFKTGAYNNSGGNVTTLPDGKPDYAQVTIYAVQVCHDDVCTGKAPSDVPVEPPPADPATTLTVTGSAEAIAALKAFLQKDTSSLVVK